MISRASTRGRFPTSGKSQGNGIDRMMFYMDLVQHDMLNDNQAVLSYLELILATPGLDRKAMDYANKALSHVRSSALRIENVNTIANAKKASVASLGPADLAVSLDDAIAHLAEIFPSKDIKVSRPQHSEEVSVVGGTLVKELLLTVMENVIKLDAGNDVSLRLSVTEDPEYGKRGWTVTIEDPRVKLPAVVQDTDIDKVHTKDSSIASKVSGFLFAKMATEALGGDFDIEPGGAGEGAKFVLRLRRAGSR